MSTILSGLPTPHPDVILKIMAEFQADPRPDKIDLGVGVYRDRQGQTPIMGAVRAAQAQIIAAETTKGYVALPGDPVFRQRMAALAFGDALDPARLASAATPGGTGAVRQAFELIRLGRADARIWVSDPTWPNHTTILQAMGMAQAAYRHYDPATGSVDFAGLLASLDGIGPGDVVLLHACCHNPTGADLRPNQWTELARFLAERGAMPMVDMAYLGFGDGLAADTIGPRTLLAHSPELLLAVSGSKSFGLYRERVGALLVVTTDPARVPVLQGTLDSLNRHAYAFPPDLGARTVSELLGSDDLRGQWADELEAMRLRIATNRQTLAHALRDLTGSDRFGFLAAHRGMFSLIGADPAQVEALRRDHGVYVITDGRINLAGLTEATIPRVAQALAEVLG